MPCLSRPRPRPARPCEISPAEVSATFDDGLVASKSSIEVIAPDDSTVATGGVAADDPKTLVVVVPPLAPGTYRVRWAAATDDGHLERGRFDFTVAEAPSPEPTPAATVRADGERFAERRAGHDRARDGDAVRQPDRRRLRWRFGVDRPDPGHRRGRHRPRIGPRLVAEPSRRMSRAQRMNRRPRAHVGLALVTCIVMALAATACDDGGQVTTGIVIDVRSSGPATVTGFTLRTDDGRLMSFRVGETGTGDGAFPSVHLRDHLASSQRVAVRYVATDDGLLAIRLADAP